MLVIPEQSVLIGIPQAIQIIRNNGIKQYITFGDGFLALNQWDDMFKGIDSKLLMDTHQYQIFKRAAIGVEASRQNQSGLFWMDRSHRCSQ